MMTNDNGVETIRVLFAHGTNDHCAQIEDLLSAHARCEFACTGDETIDRVKGAIEDGDPYDVICLQPDLPGETDGMEALRVIRAMEEASGVQPDRRTRVVLAAREDDPHCGALALDADADVVLVQPVSPNQFLTELVRLGLVTL